jgi:hypothetical protein
LGGWVNNLRQKKSDLSKSQVILLESFIGWEWDVLNFKWEEGFSNLEIFVKKEGHARVSLHYKTPSGYNLGTWVMRFPQ